jgi:hypothetical protein
VQVAGAHQQGLLFLLLAACASTPSPYTRVTADDGRVYYARMDYAFESRTGGFLTFKDLVTREDVKLKSGTYTTAECPREELDFRQRRYLDDPSRIPMASDPLPPPPR